MTIDRRSFLLGAAVTPLCVAGQPFGRWLPHGGDRLLLVLELAGGNDGLNTVIPTDDERYARARPKLGSVRRGSHALGDGTSLHPTLGRLHRRIRDGVGAVIHGVGYEHPDRSHFRSRDIWHTANPAHLKVDTGTTGWLGRAADLFAGQGAGVPAAAVGGLELPLALKSRQVTVPCLERVEDFQWLSARRPGPLPGDASVREVVKGRDAAKGSDDLAGFVGDIARAGAELADDLTTALAGYKPRAEYPDSALARNLNLTAQLAVAGFGTRLVHVTLGGFDTHARQLPTQAGLLRLIDSALDAFLTDVDKHGLGDRVAVMVHSEFGRRVAENASQGTDHGTAGPVFTFGGGLRGGTHGPVPDLEKLDRGDLIATADFRSVYADLLRWLGADDEKVLGGRFEGAGLR